MEQRADIHNYKGNFERTLERIKEADYISGENKEIILKFKDYCLSEGLGYAKITRYLCDVVKYARMLKKSFPEASKDDIRRIVGELEQTSLSPETKKCFKITLKKLYKFIRGIDEKKVYPEEVRWLSIHIPNNHRKLPEELLTEEEVMKIVQKCKTLRDKVLISVLYESGARIGEIGIMQIKHVSFEQYGVRLTVNGKTGMRKILVINSTPYLQEWINQHPENDNPEAYLWIQGRGEFLSYARISAILKDAVKKAGIRKKVYPHLLRHSRATSLASIMPEASMKQYFGWAQSSKMCQTYIHMSGKDVDDSILKASGIEIKKENIKPAMQPKKCLRCHTSNQATNRLCGTCGLPLDEEEAEKIIKADADRNQADKIMQELIKDPEILKFLVQKAKEKIKLS